MHGPFSKILGGPGPPGPPGSTPLLTTQRDVVFRIELRRVAVWAVNVLCSIDAV